MEGLQGSWDSLMQSLGENIVGVIVTVTVCAIGVILAGLALMFGKAIREAARKDEPSVLTSSPSAPAQPTTNGSAAASTPAHAPIPSPSAIGFVARRDKAGYYLVASVSALLKEHTFVALWGAGGVGKTALAAEIARGHFAVVWVSADSRADFSLGALLDLIITQVGRTDLRSLPRHTKADATRNLLEHSRALLVLDGFEAVADFEQDRLIGFLANLPCAALVTSRKVLPPAHNIAIEAMTETEAREFVSRWIEISPRRKAFAGLDASQIVSAAAANPQAMTWVIAQIEQAHDPRRVLNELAHGTDDAASRVFERAFILRQLGDRGRAALLALTLFVPHASHEALAEVAFGDVWAGSRRSPERGERSRASLPRVDDDIARLVSFHLANTTALDGRIGVAGLTRELARARRAQDRRDAQWARRYVDYFVRYAETYARKTPPDFHALETEYENLLTAMDIAFAARDGESVVRIADAIADLGGFLDLRGYWDEAVERNEQAREVLRAMKHKEGIAVLDHRLGHFRQKTGEYGSAKPAYEEALKIHSKSSDEMGAALALHRLGKIAQEQGDYEAARRRYTESLETRQKLGDERGAATALLALAKIAQGQGDHETARHRYTETLEASRKLGDQRGAADILYQLGMIAYDQGDYETAQQQYGSSLEVEKKLGNPSGIARAVHQLGNIAYQQGESEQARRYCAESLEIAQRLGDQVVIAVSLNNLGQIARDRADYGLARQFCESSLEIKRQVGYRRGIAHTLCVLAELAELEGDYRGAERCYLESLSLTKNFGDSRGVASILHQLGKLAENEGDKGNAERLFRESLAVLEKSKLPKIESGRKPLERLAQESPDDT